MQNCRTVFDLISFAVKDDACCIVIEYHIRIDVALMDSETGTVFSVTIEVVNITALYLPGTCILVLTVYVPHD